MADFHEVRFPTSISRGSSGGPRRRTDIVTLRSGYEERNAVWADSRREYDAGLGIRDINDLYDILAFFEARLGRLYGFRWKDWADYKSGAPNAEVTALDQSLVAVPGEPTVFQMAKNYTSGSSTYSRAVTKPVANSALVAQDGVLLVADVDFIIDTTTGLVYFGFEPTGVLTAGFEFDVPVRFTQDYIDISVELFSAGEVPQVNTIEVKTRTGEVNTEQQELALWNWLQAVDINTAVNTNWNISFGVS